MNTKTIIGAIIGIIVIVLIVVLAHGGHTAQTPADTSGATAAAAPATGDSADTSPVPQNTAPSAGDTVQITTTQQGTGPGAVAGDTVTVNYTGMLTDGTVFDSNTDPKFGHVQPFTFTLGQNQVIQGWEQGILGMKQGEKRHLVIPASLGYGAQGVPGTIPANATLEFDVEMVSISHS